MSVVMTLRVNGDAAKLEERARKDPDAMRAVRDRAKEFGLIAHRFYATDDGTIMIVDEWPDRESFQRFFEDQQPQIQPLMQEAGATQEPEITFWNELDTN